MKQLIRPCSYLPQMWSRAHVWAELFQNPEEESLERIFLAVFFKKCVQKINVLGRKLGWNFLPDWLAFCLWG